MTAFTQRKEQGHELLTALLEWIRIFTRAGSLLARFFLGLR